MHSLRKKRVTMRELNSHEINKEDFSKMALFESYERRIDKINAVLNSYGIASLEEAEKITKDAGLDVYDQVKKIQPICFENACWAYTVGAAIAIKKGCRKRNAAAHSAQHRFFVSFRRRMDASAGQ